MHRRVGILKPGQFVGFLTHSVREHQVTGNGLLHQLRVDLYAPVIDTLIDPVVLPLLHRHREFLQPFINVHLSVNILNAVILKLLPVRRVMLRKIPGTHPITLRWLTGHGKQLDQPLAFLVFLLAGLQHGANIL